MEKKWFDLLCRPYEELEKGQQERIYTSYRMFVYQDLFDLLVDHSLTEDLIHDSFLKVISKAPQLQSMHNIPAWIKRVAHTTGIDFIRKSRKDKKMLVAIGPLYNLCGANTVEAELEEKWKQEQFQYAIQKLNQHHRLMLNLYYLEKKSCKEIGEIIKITETATFKRLSRARQHLKALFFSIDALAKSEK
ncbi:Sigma-70 region 2 [Paenibacillus algicola]|uniref:Sigma-70 region 2 n=1 Tax=Paenibacillus algicola TaxID=2565926 RepID=A0A4P8XPD1_9BACL|nr:sigma-70 family RNA polymerase sigma factor [Paenibacillus algicola]QCT03501.1 Sigma-70 region 2 [Paenibacillus algicola]